MKSTKVLLISIALALTAVCVSVQAGEPRSPGFPSSPEPEIFVSPERAEPFVAPEPNSIPFNGSPSVEVLPPFGDMAPDSPGFSPEIFGNIAPIEASRRLPLDDFPFGITELPENPFLARPSIPFDPTLGFPGETESAPTFSTAA